MCGVLGGQSRNWCGGGVQSPVLSYTSSLLRAGSGHNTSSTSQDTFSLAKHWGKYLLAWRIQPWTEATSMSPHASSIAWRSAMRAQGWRSYTFQRQAEKNSSMGFRKGEYGGRYKTTKLWMGGKPVLDQNSPVKTNIVPCNYKSSRLLIWIV